MNKAGDIKSGGRRWLTLHRVAIALALAAFLGCGLIFCIVAWINNERLPAGLAAPPPLPGAAPAPAPRRTAQSRKPIIADTFDKYLEIRQGHEPAVATTIDLYHELIRRDREEKIQTNFDEARGYWITGQPLPPALMTWLDEHAGFVDLALRFAESEPPLPRPSRADVVASADDRKWDPLKPAVTDASHYMVLNRASRILAADGQRHLAAGDPAGAERRVRAVLRLSRNDYSDATLISRLIGFASTFTASRLLVALAGQAPADWRPSPETMTLVDTLVRDQSGRVMAVRGLEDEYLTRRAAVVRAANSGTWRSPIFGWGIINARSVTTRDYETVKRNRHMSEIETSKVTRAIEKVAVAGYAILNKHNAPANLREYDAIWQKVLAASRDYPTLRSRMGELDELTRLPQNKVAAFTRRLNFLRSAAPTYYEAQVRGVHSDALLNMARAALRLRADPTHWPAPDDKPTTDSAWLDPFSDRALHVAPDQPDPATTGTATRLWSVGPDLKDQRGALLYDSTNGTLSAGDIIILVPQTERQQGK